MASGYRVRLSKTASKYRDSQDKEMRNRIDDAILGILENPKNGSNVTALKGQLKGKHRYRVGGFRVIYEVKDNELIILIVEIGPRGDVYK